jgi:hypothetical protein
MSQVKVVNDYRIVVSGNEYTAPECRRFHLQGECSWLPADAEGKTMKMTSSPIVSVRGRVVTTRSGSTYILGKRAEGFETFSRLRKRYRGVPLT